MLRIKAVERAPGSRRRTGSAARCSSRHEYRQFVKVHATLVELAGTPPFTVALGDKSDEALVVRGAARDRARASRAAAASSSTASRASAR